MLTAVPLALRFMTPAEPPVPPAAPVVTIGFAVSKAPPPPPPPPPPDEFISPLEPFIGLVVKLRLAVTVILPPLPPLPPAKPLVSGNGATVPPEPPPPPPP